MSDYAEDLAYVHDRGFGALARSGAARLLSELHRHRLDSGRVTELGCGGGISSEIIAGAGFEVRGSDPSAAQIGIARRRVPAAAFEVADAEAAEIDPSVAVTAFGEVLNYYEAEPGGEERLARIFGRIAAALEPGGVLLFDLAGPGRVPGGSRREFAEGEDWAILYAAAERPDLTLERRMTVFREINGSWRRSVETHRLALHRAERVLELLRGAGLEPTRLDGYDGSPFAPGLVSYRALKPNA